MVVVISIDVLNSITDYANALTRYPITTSRARQKIDNLKSSLESLGTSLSTPPICMNKDLLQTFDSSGNPMNKNLKRFNYKDESGFQWAFACLYDYGNDTIIILKMIAATKVVKEDVDRKIQLMLDFNRRLMAIG